MMSEYFFSTTRLLTFIVGPKNKNNSKVISKANVKMQLLSNIYFLHFSYGLILCAVNRLNYFNSVFFYLF